MTFKNVQLVTGVLSTGEDIPTFYVDKSSGRVGIGNPASSPIDDEDDSNIFNVSGNMYATRFRGDGSGLSGLTDSKWLSMNDDIYYNTGDVSIGTRESMGRRLRVCESGSDILTVNGASRQTGINIFEPSASLHVNGSFINSSRWDLLNIVINIEDSKQSKIIIRKGESIVSSVSEIEDDHTIKWGAYNNVPDWLVGALGTKHINTLSNSNYFTIHVKCTVTGFLIDMNSKHVEDGWRELGIYPDILSVDDSPHNSNRGCKIYIKTFTAGTHVLDSSVLYAFYL